jgi:thiamine-phosphate pyrophosphorylase
MRFELPRFYAIVDSSLVPHSPSGDRIAEIAQFAEELAEGGATLIQYRNKGDSPAVVLNEAREIRRSLSRRAQRATLIMNDRADLCLGAQFDGVHLGHDDISVIAGRKLCPPPLLIGVSTHNPEQVRQADETSADYIAIGPVFATSSKGNPDPVIGTDGVRTARALTDKPLVAVGGITRQNCREVIEAGADCVAVISDLLSEPRVACQQFMQLLS